MAAKNFSIVVFGNNDEQPLTSGVKFKSIVGLIKYLRSLIGGTRVGSVTVDCRNDSVAATGTITISSGSGSISATINGTTAISVTWATSDANTASLLAAAINASSDALVVNHLTASVASNVVTLTAKHPGFSGNAITLSASGTGATAGGLANGRLSGGSATTFSHSF